MMLTPAARYRLYQQDERLALTLYRYLLDERLLTLPDAAHQPDPRAPEEDR